MSKFKVGDIVGVRDPYKYSVVQFHPNNEIVVTDILPNGNIKVKQKFDKGHHYKQPFDEEGYVWINCGFNVSNFYLKRGAEEQKETNMATTHILISSANGVQRLDLSSHTPEGQQNALTEAIEKILIKDFTEKVQVFKLAQTVEAKRPELKWTPVE